MPPKKSIIDLSIPKPKASAHRIETPPELPALHSTTAFIGPRGSGKSTAAFHLLDCYKKAGCIDRIFCISPSVKSNWSLMSKLDIDDQDIYEDPDQSGILEDIIGRMEEERLEFEQYLDDKKDYELLNKYISKDIQFDDELGERFFDGTRYEAPKPPEFMGGKVKARLPNSILLIDDCQGSKLLDSRALTKLVIKNRHVCQISKEHQDEVGYPACGLSVMLLCQSYKSKGGGLSKAIRGNLTGLAFYKNKSDEEIDAVANECCAECSKQEFRKVYEKALEGPPYSFLFVDFSKKTMHPSMFRRNFNEFIIPTQIE